MIDEVQRQLARKFAHLPADRISAAVLQAHARFAQSPVRDFVPLLVERRAGARLSGDTGLVGGHG